MADRLDKIITTHSFDDTADPDPDVALCLDRATARQVARAYAAPLREVAEEIASAGLLSGYMGGVGYVCLPMPLYNRLIDAAQSPKHE